MINRRTILTSLLIFLSISVMWGESNGKVLSIKYENTLKPHEIDAFNEELFEGNTAPKAQFSVQVYWLEFESLYPDGEKAVITTQIFLPVYRDTDLRSMYVFGPGSTGLRDNCRPFKGTHYGDPLGLLSFTCISSCRAGIDWSPPRLHGFRRS